MTYEIPASVAWVAGGDFIDWDHNVYAMVLPDGEPVILEGTAAMAWLVIADGQPVVETMAELTATPPERVASDLSGFLADLADRGLLHVAEEAR